LRKDMSSALDLWPQESFHHVCIRNEDKKKTHSANSLTLLSRTQFQCLSSSCRASPYKACDGINLTSPGVTLPANELAEVSVPSTIDNVPSALTSLGSYKDLHDCSI